jgi:peptidyl-prolyl cis-trans isomerase C
MEKKNKTPIIAAMAVLLIALGVGGYFFMQNSNTADDSQQVTASNEDPQAPQAADVEAAAGDAQDEVQPNINLGEFTVEPGNPVVAKVEGKDITRNDVYRFIQTMPANMQQLPATQVYPVAMEQVLNTQLVQIKAENADITNTPEFQKEMDIARQQIMRNLFLQKEVDAKISEEKIRKEYNDFVKAIPDVEERRARHILVDTEEKAKAILERVKKEDADFAALAAELSMGPTKSRGGDLGYFAKNEMVPEFAEAAFKMKKDTVLEEPVKTQFGYHIIKLLDVRERAKPTYEQFAPSAIAEMRRQIMQDLLDKWKKQAEIEQFDINGQPLKKGANVIGIVPEEPKKDEEKQDG